ncbi:MAG TPA: S1/P1 nuclease [Salinimicrobium sp.]|nr:S1/P1 nuclease [Salinimicrobium sp.]
MKYFLLIAAFLFSTISFASDEDWGKNGHRATAQIASKHLTEKARKKIEKILDGQSLALVSTFGDDIKSDDDFRKYDPWHYVNLEKGQATYSKKEANPDGDLVFGIRKAIEILENENSSKEDKAFYLKMLVHFMGDLHQPLHTGRGEDKGGNDIQVRWFGQGTNLHRVWDSQMIEDFQMSYSELAANAEDLSKREIKEIASGDVLDWMYESKSLSNKVYDSVEIGEKLGYEYTYVWFPVVREQLQKGGIRLAAVLNDIFE